MNASLERIALHRLKVPLHEPYQLSFGPVEWFDTIIVETLHRDGGRGCGEATVLTGYTDETIADAWDTARELAQRIAAAPHRAQEALQAREHTHPFTVTAFRTAQEMAAGNAHLAHAQAVRVPLVGLLHAREEAAMAPEFDRLIGEGYRTVKLKVGFEVGRDIEFVRSAQRANRGRTQLRIDANQGYTTEQAKRFVGALAPEAIELFEQPCAAGDWDAHLAVAAVSPVPLMLDESIYGMADIERAAELKAAAYIKVKLMKMGGLDALAASLVRIRELGMRPVLGNGVACDLGCWMEACVAARFIDNAGEMNGFLKACGALLTPPLAFRDGALLIEAGYRPQLDPEALRRYAVDALTVAVAPSAYA